MYARAFDMLHNTGNQNILAVADSINFGFGTLQIFIDKDRVLLRIAVDDRHELFDFLVGNRDLHALAAKYVGRTYKHGIAQTVSNCLCFLRCENSGAFRSLYAGFLQNLIKDFAVFRRVHILGIRAENRHTEFCQSRGQLNGRLSSELHNSVVGVLDVNDVFHVFGRQRLKIQLVRNVKVRGNRLGVVVDDNCLEPSLRKSPGRVNRTVVKFDALADADRTGAENQNLPALRHSFRGFVHVISVINRIEVRRLRLELRGTGIYHFVSGGNAAGIASLRDFFFGNAGITSDHVVRKLESLCLRKQFVRQLPLAELFFHTDQCVDSVDKPLVDHRDFMDRRFGNSFSQSFRNDPDPLVVHNCQPNKELFLGQMAEIIAVQRVNMLLERADRLHQSAFKRGADCHDLACRLHLCRQGSLGGDEFVERQPRHLDNAVVERGLKGRVCFAGNGVSDLIQRKSERDFGRNLRDRIAGRLGSQRGRTGHTRVYLNNTVFKACRMKRELHVTAARDLQLVDDVERRSTQHLIFLVGERL